MTSHEGRGERDAEPMIGRREACKRIGLLGSAVMFAGIYSLARAMTYVERLPSGLEGQGLPRRQLGRTGVTGPILALGGWHFLKTSDEEGNRIVQEAIDAGLTFFDNSWDYHNNRSEAVMGKALKGHRHKVFLMTKMCTHGRGKNVGMLHLEQSLRRLGTDYLDLWQIHEVGCNDDPERLFQEGGAIEALAQAKQQGKVRFIGFTGHTNPVVHLNVLKYNVPFDTCQLPLNPFDASYKSFERQVLPELQAWHRAHCHEITLWERKADSARYSHGRRGDAICAVLAGVYACERHRFTRGVTSEPGHRQTVRSHDAGGNGAASATGLRSCDRGTI